MATECIRWSAFSSSVSASFCSFWENELFTDVTVTVPGGAAVAAHRAVLAARSAELRRLLVPPAGQGEWQPAPLLLLRGVSPGQLQLLLQLLYTGHVQADQSQLRELLELCRELEVEGLDADSLRPLEEASDEREAETGPGSAHAPSSSQPPTAELGTLAAEAAAAAASAVEASAPAAAEAAAPAAAEAAAPAAAEAAAPAAEAAAIEVAEASASAIEAKAASAVEVEAASAVEAEAASAVEAEAAVSAAAASDRFGLPAGGGACWSECWLPSAPPQSPPPSPSGGPPRPYTPVTDRVDSDGEDEARGRTPELSPSVTTEDGGSQERDDRWPGEPVGGAGSSATFRHVSSLLDSLDRRQLLQLRERADQIMHPDFTAWLPDELMVNILSRLSPRDLLVAAGACRRWQALSEDDSLWRRCLKRTGAALPPGTVGSPQTALQSRLLCIRYLGWTELPLPTPKRLKGHESVIRCMAVDGDRIVTGSSDKTVGIWSASSGRLTCRLRGESEVTCVQVEGDTVVTAGRDCTLGVWNAVSGRRRPRLYGHDGIVWSVALHGGRVASGSDDKTVRFWDIHSCRQLAVLRSHETVVRAVCFDGHWVVSGDDAGRVQVWSAERRTVETIWHARSRYVMVLQHAHGVVVSGHGDGAINVWDMATRHLRHELRGHTGWVTDVCVSPQGLLLSGCKDGTAILWGLSNGILRHRLSGHQGHRQRVTAVRLLSGLAVTGSRDGRVKLWDSSTGVLVRDLVTPEVSSGPVKHVWVGPDRLVCGVQNNASDRPQVLVMEMALWREDGAAVGGIDVAAVGAEGGSGL